MSLVPGPPPPRIVQLVLAMHPIAPGQVVQLLIGLDSNGRLWKKQLGSQFSAEWLDWVPDTGASVAELEQHPALKPA